MQTTVRDWLIWLWFDPVGILVWAAIMIAFGLLVVVLVGAARRVRGSGRSGRPRRLARRSG